MEDGAHDRETAARRSCAAQIQHIPHPLDTLTNGPAQGEVDERSHGQLLATLADAVLDAEGRERLTRGGTLVQRVTAPSGASWRLCWFGDAGERGRLVRYCWLGGHASPAQSA